MLIAAHPRFIVVEGIDGSGKSSICPLIADHLRSTGEEVVLVAEPGGTDTGQSIRAMIRGQDESSPITPVGQVLLLFAAREQLLHEVVLPALGRGAWVVCDRYVASTWAYQGCPETIGIIAELDNRLRARPGLTLLLDLPAEEAARRRAKRAGPMDYFDAKGVSFFEKVRRGYEQWAATGRGRAEVIDATSPVALVQAAAVAAIDRHAAAHHCA